MAINNKVYAQEVLRKEIDLSLSENPLGCSPLVFKALKKMTMRDISQYPDVSSLIKKIAVFFKIKTENIAMGCGSEQLIKLISQIFLKPGDKVLIPQGSFPLFTKECLSRNVKIELAEPEKFLRSSGKIKLIFLCNPNNPTGEKLEIQVITKILKCFPTTIFVIDEANGEFMDNSMISTSVKSSNLIILKTFSKVFGLAGLRVGFAVGSNKIISKLNSNQQPFPVSSISVKLAEIALNDPVFIRKTIDFIRNERSFLIKELIKRKLNPSVSITNNIYIKTPRAKLLIKQLSKKGVSVIPGNSFPGIRDAGFRLSIKDRKTNIFFLKKLDEILTCET